MRKSFGDKLAAIVSDVANANGVSTSVRNAHDFITNKTYGLGLNLYPAQSVILKAHYGLPLDKVRRFDIKNWSGELVGTFTEEDLLKYWFDQGRSNIREVDVGHELTTMILSLGRRSGKCVTGSTWVLTDQGFVQIRDLEDTENDDEYQPLEVGVAQRGKRKSKSAYFYRGGKKPTKGLRTDYGYTIEGTLNHRIKVLDPKDGRIKWKYLEDIVVGDVVVIHRSTNLWTKRAKSLFLRDLKRNIVVVESGYEICNLDLDRVQTGLANLGVVSKREGRSLIVVGRRSIARLEQSLKLPLSGKGEPEKRGHYFFDSVREIWHGENQVYDLNVPEGESFVANALINHNTTLSASIVAYETYKLIKKGDPQSYYGTIPGDVIQLASLATARDQAQLLFNGVNSHLNNCAFFRPYMANNTQTMVKMQTPKDIEMYGRYADNEKAKASIKVTFLSSNAAGIRGSGNMVVIFDEVAFFPTSGPGGAEEVYQAMSPSLAQYTPKDPDDPQKAIGDLESRIIMISSPAGKQGLFYNKFRQAMEKKPGSEHMLAIQAPTWEVNITVPKSVFVDRRSEDPRIFQQEFGSEFSDQTYGFLEDTRDLLDCIDPLLRKRYQGQPKLQYFIGGDLAQVNDASAVAIVHLEGDKIVVDYVGRIKAGEGDFEDQARLETEDVTQWVQGFYQRFLIKQGIGDQWSAASFHGPFERYGIKNFEFKKWSPSDKTEMWKTFKSLMYDRRLVLYDISEEERSRRVALEEDVPNHEPYIEEFFSLQVKQKSKNLFDVEARHGAHDDMADALARAVWLASQQESSQKHIVGASTGAVGPELLRRHAALRAQSFRRARQKARLGGSHPSRMVPKGIKYR